MTIWGALQIDAVGNILGTITSSGPDCIVFSKTVVEVDATRRENLVLLMMPELSKTHYWDYSHEVIANKTLQDTCINKAVLTADGVDVIVINNVPKGFFSAVTVSAGNLVAEQKPTISGVIKGADTFATTVPGCYKIKIEAFPYLDFETMIEAI